MGTPPPCTKTPCKVVIASASTRPPTAHDPQFPCYSTGAANQSYGCFDVLGEVYAVYDDVRLCIRRLHQSQGQWWLHSDNTDQRIDRPLAFTEEIRVVDKVVLKQSEHI